MCSPGGVYPHGVSGGQLQASPVTPASPHRSLRTLGYLARVPVTELRGVGARNAGALGELGITNILDLLTHYPYRYHDQTRQATIGQLGIGEEAWVRGRVRRVHASRTRNRRSLVEVEVTDGSDLLQVSFFNQAWRSRQLVEGTEALFFGKLEMFRSRRKMTNPSVDLVGDQAGRIVAVYPASGKAGITSRDISGWMAEVLDRSGEFADPLGEELRGELGLVDRTSAFRGIHQPAEPADHRRARERLAFDELLRLQLQVVMRRNDSMRSARGIRHVLRGPSAGRQVPDHERAGVGYDDGADLLGQFTAGLPFPLTGAQRRAIDEIAADLAGPLPMRRLLQGDVGAGKTVVALAALLVAVQGGYQGALMAPTEVLAEQHFLGVCNLLAGMAVPDQAVLGGERPVGVRLLTSRTPSRARAKVLDELASGATDLVVGTHALLTDEVCFARLGVAVVDEQHRFGVEQRALLGAKGRGSAGVGADPVLLVMTATPIPRSAAMVVFGDLDMTILDELPPGRRPVTTVWARTPGAEAEAWQRLRDEVAAGHRAYVVCPLVEGSERIQARSAVEEHERLAAGVLAGIDLGLLHGQMRPADKEAVMTSFRSGQVKVLVATTVIEVGVDVPEATVMVVLDADRFGIAQLHQLRGRVGRSSMPSWCFLFGGALPGASDEATPGRATGAGGAGPGGGDPGKGARGALNVDSAVEKRLTAVEASVDGFELAEVDLELRGEGSILGTRQKGRSDLKLASLRRGDKAMVIRARRVAEELLGEDHLLLRHPLLADELRLLMDPGEAEFLSKG